MGKHEEALTGADVYRDANRLKETMATVAKWKAELPKLYEHWEEAVELNNE